MKRILLTGSRDWTNRSLIESTLSDLFEPDSILVHGDCKTGADKMGDEIWTELGGKVEKHQAKWNLHGRAAGPIRNQEMVDLGAYVCLAFIKNGSKGATGCAEMAVKANIPIDFFYED